MLVSGARNLLTRFQISDLPFGMTILAFLVSIEELERELPAARQGRPDISFGNVRSTLLPPHTRSRGHQACQGRTNPASVAK